MSPIPFPTPWRRPGTLLLPAALCLLPATLAAQGTRERDLRVLEELMPRIASTANDSGLHYIDQALLRVGVAGDPEVRHYLHSYRAEELYYQGLFDEAMTDAMTAMHIAQELGDSLLIANEYNLIGLLHENIQDDREALPHLRSALAWYPRNGRAIQPLSELYHIHGNLGQSLLRLGEVDSALHHLARSAELARAKNAPRGIAIAEWALGQAMLATHRPEEALAHFARSMAVAHEAGQRDVVLENRSELARAWMALGERDSALHQLERGEELLEGDRSLSGTSCRDFRRKATEVFARLGLDDRALASMRAWHTMDSAINAQNKRSALLTLKGLYETNQLLEVEQLQRRLYADALERVRFSRTVLAVGAVTGLLLVLASYLAYRSRQRGRQRLADLELLRLQQEKIIGELRIREQVGRDMHDDLGAGLSSLKLRSELAARAEQDPAKKAQLEATARQAGELIASMRQIIWAMNGDQGTLEDLVAYSSAYARNYLQEHALSGDVIAKGPWPDVALTPGQRRNLFLVLKEALHNVVKHASAHRADVHLTWNDGDLLLTVKDDGVGMATPPGPSGNGLRNIRERIALLGGTCHIDGTAGTEVRCSMPLTPANKGSIAAPVRTS